MSEFLIQAKGHWMDTLTQTEISGMDQLSLDDYTSRTSKGDIVVVKPDGWPWGNAECLPDYIVVKVPDIAIEEALQHCDGWRAVLSFAVLSSNLATDTHTCRVTADKVNVNTGEGKITQARIQNYLNSWNLKNAIFGDNSVEFDATIAEVIQSNKVWGRDMSLCTWTEVSYTQSTGVHRIRIDASAYSLTSQQWTKFVADVSDRAAFISKNDGGRRVTLDVSRMAVRDMIQGEATHVYNRIIRKYRHAISASDVDSVIAAGGTMTINKSMLLSKLRDKMNIGE
jgi:hypothetical protein